MHKNHLNSPLTTDRVHSHDPKIVSCWLSCEKGHKIRCYPVVLNATFNLIVLSLEGLSKRMQCCMMKYHESMAGSEKNQILILMVKTPRNLSSVIKIIYIYRLFIFVEI